MTTYVIVPSWIAVCIPNVSYYGERSEHGGFSEQTKGLVDPKTEEVVCSSAVSEGENKLVSQQEFA